MVTKDEIKAALSKVDLKQVVAKAKATLDLSKVPSENLEKLVYIATHCALNGPVGADKETTFKGKEKEWKAFKINSLWPEFSNAVWKTFVEIIADELDLKNEDVKGSYCVKKYGIPWPKCDLVFKPKPKKEAA